MNSLIKYYYENEKYLFEWALTFCRKNKMDAEDLVQDCLLKICKIPESKISSVNKSFWIVTFRNRSINDARKNYNKAIFIDLSALKKSSVIQYHSLDVTFINSLVNTLPKSQISTMKLMIDGYSNTEISEKLNIPRNSITAYECKSRKTLKHLLGKFGFCLGI